MSAADDWENGVMPDKGLIIITTSTVKFNFSWIELLYYQVAIKFDQKMKEE